MWNKFRGPFGVRREVCEDVGLTVYPETSFLLLDHLVEVRDWGEVDEGRQGAVLRARLSRLRPARSRPREEGEMSTLL